VGWVVSVTSLLWAAAGLTAVVVGLVIWMAVVELREWWR
jgi:hypothetical protein